MSRRTPVAFVVVTLLSAIATDLAGQAGDIRGRVIRADGPVPLANALVVLSPSQDSTRTDARGVFMFAGVASNQVEVTASQSGFVTAVVALRVDTLSATEVEIALEPVAAILDPIVISALRDAKSVGDVGRAVSVADAAAIGRDRTVGLHEVLRTMPGVQVASRFGTDDITIGIRGSAARARQAVRGVAVLLDGVPITEPDGVARLDLIELGAARQVEVVRGPASALYAGSSGGVVNVVSRSGRDSPGITGRIQAGSFGFRKYDVRAGGLFAGVRGSGLAAVSYTSADGYRAHSDANILRGHAVFDYAAGPGTQLALQASGSRIDSRLPGSLSLPEVDADPDAASPPAVAFGFGRVDNRYRAGARVETAVGSTVAGAYFFYGGRTLLFPIPSEIVDLDFKRVQAGGRVRSRRIGGLPLDAAVGVDHDHVFGTDRRWENDAGDRGALHDDGRDAVPSIGAHAQLEWRALADLTATLGLRYDRVTYRFESVIAGGIPRQEITFDQASPRLGALWRPDASTSVYASVGRGFEVPAIGELSPSPGDSVQSVRPKTLWNYEVGARSIVNDRVRLEAAAFLATVRGEFVPVTVNEMSLPENASRSRNVGFELGVTAVATTWLDLGASYAFLDLLLQDFTTTVLDSTGTGREVDFSGKRLPAVPRHRFTAAAQVRPRADLDLGVQVEWQSVVYVETTNADRGTWFFLSEPDGPVQGVPFRAVPARALVHVNAALRLGPTTLFGSVENLFGQWYAGNIVANASFGRFYDPGSPARVSLGLSVAGFEGGG